MAVVAVHQRRQQALDLSKSLGGIPISVDHGYGPGRNHDRALILANAKCGGESDWTLFLEDDAQPVPDFLTQVPEALTACPTSAASLYLGNQRSPSRARKLERLLPEDPHWVVTHTLLHAVCFAIRTPLLHQLLTTVENITRLDADERYGWGLRQMGGYQIAHTTVSLVDHADEQPVIGQRRDRQPRVEPRKALKVGGRTSWSDSYLTL